MDNFDDAQTRTSWRVHSLTLGNEAATFAEVDGIGLQSGYGLGFSTIVGGADVPFVISVKDDFSAGAYWKASDSSSFEMGLALPGWPGNALRLR